MSQSDENDVTAETTAEEYAPLEQDSPTPAESAEPPLSRTRRVAIALAALLTVSVALTCWLYVAIYRADQQLGAEAEQAAMAAAADGAVAVLTYSPKTLETDFAAAERHLTGDFLSYYTDFTQKVVTPAAKQKEVQTLASVVRKGIVSLAPTRAEVLIFVNQTTISKTNPDGAFSMSSVRVGLEKHDGRWLISSFDPV
ncbi:twin-arginine translocation pathway signal [[Mycobacterium] nativiensis]|uniref:Twin-arginine translocation pathway signal n=1 Tax=[Mycobacterium] nativiensis TaxID=2855503 RepID=A0ABU5XR16_9MYCO|nr:twin-arginine translocation pathway signal [Mycolicibacter sp. MYC340]MEB3030128.1 twin-arginine translocation pathway signal [Mycolicibacter sp. MYC340]